MTSKIFYSGCKKAVAGFLAILLLLAAAELVLRGLYGAPKLKPLPQAFQYNYVDTLKPFFTVAKRLPYGITVYKPNRVGATSQIFLMPKPAGAYRIFIVGGSVGVRFVMDKRFFPVFRRLFHGRAVELISCGMPGYDSGQTLAVVRQIFQYAPDLIVDMDGNNEYGRSDMTPAQIRLYLAGRFMSRFRVYRGLAAFIAEHLGRPRLQTPIINADIETNFENNLRRIVRLCRRRGVPIILCTLPANLRDMPPEAQAPSWQGPLCFRAMWAFEQGNYRRARVFFEAYLKSHPADPFAHFYLARCLDRLGLKRAAAAQYGLAANWDSPGQQTPPRRNADIRRIARQERVPLADLEKLFWSWARLPGAPGNALFRDGCHWWFSGDPAVLQAVLSDAFPWNKNLRVGARWPASWLPPWFPTVGFMMTAAGEGLYMQDGRFDEAEITMFGRAYESNPRLFMATILHPRAALSAPSWPWDPSYGARLLRKWPLIMGAAGEMFRRRGLYRQALICAKESLAQAPGNVGALLVKALTLAEMKHTASAGAIFKRLRRDYPGRQDIRYWAQAAGVSFSHASRAAAYFDAPTENAPVESVRRRPSSLTKRTSAWPVQLGKRLCSTSWMTVPPRSRQRPL